MGASSAVKSYSGYFSDKIGKRTPIMYLGYALTGVIISAIGFSTSWLQVLALRVGAWMGRGARGPPRDALLTESVPVGAVGKAFGFQRGMDTCGSSNRPGHRAFPHTIPVLFFHILRLVHPGNNLGHSRCHPGEGQDGREEKIPNSELSGSNAWPPEEIQTILGWGWAFRDCEFFKRPIYAESRASPPTFPGSYCGILVCSAPARFAVVAIIAIAAAALLTTLMR
jgi:hypothetical protein